MVMVHGCLDQVCSHLCTCMGMTQIDLNLKVLETNSLFMSTQLYVKVISGYLD